MKHPLLHCLLLTTLLLLGEARHGQDAQLGMLERLCADGSHFVFESYVPSEFDELWHNNAETWSEKVCSVLHDSEISPKTSLWIEQVHKFSSFAPDHPANYSALKDMDPTVFSRFVYKDVCNSDRGHVEIFIEPIAGLLRHPYAVCPNVKTGTEANLMSKDFILVNAVPQYAFAQMYPGKKYLFDIGAGYYNTSLKEMVGQYEVNGITFDEIYAWEVSPLDDKAYFEDVTKYIVPKLHLYNFPVQHNVHANGHPLAILRQVYRPGDFVVIKLDIDFPELEQSILDHLVADQELRRMVAELYYEAHMDVPDMRPWFGENTGVSYSSAVHSLRKIRSSGIRLHSWP